MPHLLTGLRIGEVSSVDQGAGEGVRIVLMKRDVKKQGEPGRVETVMDIYGLGDAALVSLLKANAPLIAEAHGAVAKRVADEVDAYMKREFSDEKRKELARTGAAMPGGGYPIENVEDLKNAIRAIGRAKNPAETKRHIISRARALGHSELIPEGWKADKRSAAPLAKFLARVGFRKDAIDFDTAQAGEEANEYAQGMLKEFEEALTALHQSVCSIVCDDEIADKRPALEQTFQQFKDHIQGVVPEGLEDAMAAAGLIAEGYSLTDGGALTKGVETMTEAELKKQIDEAVAKALAPVTAELAKSKRENAILKMSDKHRQYAEDMKMSEEEKGKFAEKTPEERDAHMAKHPVEKAVQLPEAVQKALAQAEEDRKVLKALQEKDEAARFAKRAVELGAPEAFGEVLRKAHAGDKEALAKLEAELGKAIRGQAAQDRTSKLFAEFGKAGTGSGVSAYDQLIAKADELVGEVRKSGKKLTREQAFAKVYQDPANRELVELYKRESEARAA